MSSTQASQVSALLDGLASGAVEIVDLTQPLSETTPVIQLAPPFANTPGLSREEISKYDDRGPAWAWYTLTIGEHVGTHVDAPIHWVTGRDGKDIGSIEPKTLVGPACVIDKTAETEAAGGDYLLTVADLEAWEAENSRIPEGAWVLLRTGWDARAQDQEAFLNLWRSGAHYDREVVLDAADIVPQVTWGTSPQDVLPITGIVPDPDWVRSKSTLGWAARSPSMTA